MIDLLKGIQEEKRDMKALAEKELDKLIRMLELIKKEASEITEKVKMLEEQSKRTLEFVNQIKGTNTYKYIEIEKLDLSVRAYNCLKRAEINTVQDILDRLEELPSVRNLGAKAYAEVMDKVKRYMKEKNE